MDKNIGTILQMELFFIIPYAPCMVYLSTCWPLFGVNVGKYSIHGAYGYGNATGKWRFNYGNWGFNSEHGGFNWENRGFKLRISLGKLELYPLVIKRGWKIHELAMEVSVAGKVIEAKGGFPATKNWKKDLRHDAMVSGIIQVAN